MARTGDGFIDRSKVRILLCDNDAKSLKEVFTLLCKCSHQVRSRRQVTDALNAEGPHIDLILSLGLVEKNILSYDFDLVVSEPSDPNTNSTTLFLDDTDDKSWKCVNSEMCPSSMLQEEARYKSAAAPVETAVEFPSKHQPDAPGTDDRKTGEISPFPKKSELKIGKSSAFFTYVKSSLPKSNGPSTTSIHESVPQQLGIEEKTSLGHHVQIDTKIQVTGDMVESQLQGDGYPSSNNNLKSFSIERSCTPPLSQEFPHYRNSKMEEFSQAHMHLQNKAQHDVSSFHAQTLYPFYIPGVMNHVMMPSTQIYQKSMHHFHNHANPNMQGMSSYPFYPMGMCLQPCQLSTPYPWHSFGSSSSAEIKVSKVDHRETGLMKFRQKRKEICFDKKTRHVNQKQLAERRPRSRGQFVRKVNGVNVDLNGQPAFEDDEDVEEEEEQIEILDSSHEDDL
ncbi:hypothetical protein RND71_010374 [Anisodus tanguticus]|uniref:CCT domain-containing protein n=1 Tax=Anisodus tanguticus TaxID=243964 RepID=A0AAE1VS37_9SOLA|nr:hypothetical protein RND71_010374 [Anisodus tanguticus]